LKRTQTGDTRVGTNRVERYAYPTAPFGNQPDRAPMVEDGAEKVYVMNVDRPAVNIGVSILDTSTGAEIDPFFLGAKDETSVQGFAGTPVNVNSLTFDYLSPVGAAGASSPRQGRYYVAVDSRRGEFDEAPHPGRYVLRSWVNDVRPPTLKLLSTRVSAGRPTLVFRALDTQSGVDPGSLAVGYKGALVGVGSFDWQTGIATFPLPGSVPALKAGTTVRATMIASDFQEAKNIDTIGPSIMPNTKRASAALTVVHGITVDWLTPSPNACVGAGEKIEVVAGGPAALRSVTFTLDGRRIGRDSSDDLGIWSSRLPHRLRHGRHRLVATAADGKRRSARAAESVRTCSG
jgi:hypothetical protein